MKKILNLLLIVALVFTLFAFTACGDNDVTPDNSSNSENTNTSSDNGNQQPADDEDLQAAYDYIKLTYKTLGSTPKSFELMKGAPIGDKLFAITWSTNNEAITITESEDGDYYVVNIPELGDAAISYTLNFSIENEKGDKKEGSFNLTVPAFKINTYAEYAAAADGTMLTVRGIVTAIVSKTTGSTVNGLYLMDANGEGGYYIYGIEEDPYGVIAIGATVEASGAKALYNGNYQLKNPTIEVIDATAKPVTPVDYTEIFAGAADLKDAALVDKQAMLITIKGVTVLEVSDKYYYFELAGKKTYVYISSSNNPATEEDLDAIKKSHADNYYNSADVTGIIGLYGGELTLYPVGADCFTNFTEIDKPDSFKVEQAMKENPIKSIYQTAGTVTLPTTSSIFDGVSIAWELVETYDCATLDGNTLTITIPETAQTITVKGTFTLNDVVASKEYTVTVKGIDTISIKDVDNIVADFIKNQYTDEVFYVVGTIQQISNDIYGNMYIVAIIDGGEYGVDIYGLNDANGKKYSEFTGYKPQVGDTIKVLTVVGKYNNAQLKSAVLVEYNHNYVPEVTDPTCQAQGYTTYTCPCGDSYVDNYVDKSDCAYGDDDVCDVCGVKNHTHTTVATEEVVAPTCTTKGYTVYACSDEACAYTEKKDETDVLAHVDANGDFTCDADGCGAAVLPAADSVLTIEQAIALGNLFKKDSYTTGKYYITGTIKEVYNDQYGNMYLTDGTNEITIYGTYSADGSLRYDKLAVKPKAGDTITVYGIIGFYSAPQMKNGWIQHSNTEEVTDATCTAGGYTTYTCKFCGTTSTGNETDALGHNFVENECDRCGALNHTHNYAEAVTAPTCTAEGYTTYTCDCGDSYTGNKVDALGHVDENGDYKCDRTGCTGLVLPAEGTTLTITEALKIGALFTKDKYSSVKYYVTGTVKNVYNTQYGNMYITDGTNEFCVYGTYSADGSTRYDKLTVKPVAGDTVTVYGVIGFYSAAQMKNGWITEHTAHECDFSVAATCTSPVTCSKCGAAQAGSEALGHDYSEATCTTKATCSRCNGTTGDYAEHNYVDGTCSACGATEGSTDAKQEMSVSKTHNEIASIAGVTAGQNTGVIANKEIALNEDITIVAKKGSATSDPCIYTESIRLYQNGATLTIKAAEGCEMTTIIIHLASKTDGQGPITVTGGTASALSNRTYTITVEAGVSEVVITTAGTSKTTRLYVDNITVEYEK